MADVSKQRSKNENFSLKIPVSTLSDTQPVANYIKKMKDWMFQLKIEANQFHLYSDQIQVWKLFLQSLWLKFNVLIKYDH